MDVKQIVLAERPSGMPNHTHFRFENITLPPLKNNEVRVKGLFYSVDPYMRMRMNEGKSYIPAFEVNEPISGGAIATIVESKNVEFAVGDHVVGMLPWSTEAIVPGNGLHKIDPSLISPTYFLGVLGMPGLTAHFGLIDICKPKSKETVVVSGAAGAVGLVVGQIAKLKDCTVVGIAGSDEKAQLLKTEFGFDEVLNYKNVTNLSEQIAALCPKGIDIYFDNVGGEISDAVMNHINQYARIAICGQISQYNSQTQSIGPRVQPTLLVRSALMQGFIIFNYAERFPEAIAELSGWIQEGKLKFRETIVDGFDKLPDAFLGLFSGSNTGKMIVRV